MENVLFWRTRTTVGDFESAFDNADVEFVEFLSEEEFDDTDDIYEIPSDCICYNPECTLRRYKDEEGRIYARCDAADVAGDIAEQLNSVSARERMDALADVEEYIISTGYYVTGGQIVFSAAPEWWREQCARWIAEYFSEEDDDD